MSDSKNIYEIAIEIQKEFKLHSLSAQGKALKTIDTPLGFPSNRKTRYKYFISYLGYTTIVFYEDELIHKLNTNWKEVKNEILRSIIIRFPLEHIRINCLLRRKTK